ncbi:hypothetical protein BGY98DRAFT_1177310 [Russula aff. rugulosa BPL654]|nr:hypothetical protein BGY98DRAFT_1177310 [Russula aff. rugulosa BPL654]
MTLGPGRSLSYTNDPVCSHLRLPVRNGSWARFPYPMVRTIFDMLKLDTSPMQSRSKSEDEDGGAEARQKKKKGMKRKAPSNRNEDDGRTNLRRHRDTEMPAAVRRYFTVSPEWSHTTAVMLETWSDLSTHCTVVVVVHVASRLESDRAEEPSALAPMRVDALFQ